MDHVKYIKLVNGENIIVTTDTDCKNFKDNKVIMVVNPIQIVSLKLNQGPLIVESFAMSPWIKMAMEDAIELPTESIVVAVDLHPQAVEQYKKFVEDLKGADSEVTEASDEEVEELLEGFEQQEEEHDREFDRKSRRKKFGTTIH